MSKDKMPQIGKNYFKVHLFLLKLAGVSVKPIENKYLAFVYNIYSAILYIFVFYAYTITECIGLISNWGDSDKVTSNICFSITHAIGAAKATLLLTQRKNIWKYCRRLETGLFKPDLQRGGVQEFKLINAAINLCNKQLIFFCVLVLMVVTNLCIFVFFNQVQEFPEVNSNFTDLQKVRSPPFVTWFPFDTTTSPYYEIAFFYQAYCAYLYGIPIGFIDTFVSGLLVHISVQLKIVSNTLHGLIESSKRNQREDGSICVESKNVLEKIPKNLEPCVYKIVKRCTDHYQEIIEFSEKIENEFSLLLLVQFSGSLVLFCFVLYQLSMMKIISFQFLSMACYYGLMLLEIILLCWSGNEVQLQSSEISHGAYDCDWIVLDESAKRALLLMMMRAQRPIKMTAGKFSFLSLETLMSIVRGSVSYFMVLRQMDL